MVYAPLVERGHYLFDLLDRPIDEVRGMNKLINRLEKYKAALAVQHRYESGGADPKNMSAEDGMLLQHLIEENTRLKNYGYNV